MSVCAPRWQSWRPSWGILLRDRPVERSWVSRWRSWGRYWVPRSRWEKKSLSKTISKLQPLRWSLSVNREKRKRKKNHTEKCSFERRDNRVQLKCPSRFSKSFLCWPKHTDRGSEFINGSLKTHIYLCGRSHLSLYDSRVCSDKERFCKKHCVLITHTEVQQNRSLYVQWIWERLSEAALVWLSWCQTIVLRVFLRPYEPQVNVHRMHAERRPRSVFPRQIHVNEAGGRRRAALTEYDVIHLIIWMD